ncbi:hypothetical protein GCM10007049_11530 [Echinicola pacifica]|uniref:Methyltransferase domain-containing protein n=1 Tax=Echinicola pacifica TaxID=346377 RepID=A0A918PRN1_9BACT|nr:class I SAM-dependent methyltransferase [Echinicola pacifica]GGZ20643.1 hypothetical protein GCM10007049_11530 [Echinicola pacifica]
MDAEKKNTVCVACGNERDNIVFYASEKRLGLGHKFDYMECGLCLSLQLVSPPENMMQYYSSEYFSFRKLKNCGFIGSIFKRSAWLFYKWGIIRTVQPAYLNWLRILRATKHQAIADIGCGNGQLSYDLRCCGFDNQYGYDPFLPKEVKEPGLTLQGLELQEVRGKFDIVMMNHSFEYMEYPQEIWGQLSKIVKEDGKLLIRLPVTDSEVWRKERADWFQLDPPRHLFIPSIKAMNDLGKKFGFHLFYTEFDSTEAQFAYTSLYKQGRKMVDHELEDYFSKEELKSLKAKAAQHNRYQIGDQVCLYYQKVADLPKASSY